MRWLLIAIAAAFLATSSPALAGPKVAVTPMKGDADDKVGAAVREVLDGKLTVVGGKDVERAMDKLGLSGSLGENEVEKLRQRLDAAVVVQGKLGRAGKKKTLKLVVSVRGKKANDFTIQYKSVGSEKFRDAMREQLMKRIGSVDDSEEKPRKVAEEDEKPKKKKFADGEEDEKPKKKKVAEAEDEKPKKKKKVAEAEAEDEKPKKKKKKKVAQAQAQADDEDGEKPRARKRGRGGEGDGEGVREPAARPLPAVRVDAGASYSARYLTYNVGAESTMKPPKVFTPAPSGRIEAELYPLAFASRKSPLAGLGVFFEYDKTFGLSIDVPRTMGKSAPINQAHYAVGARYRLAFGSSAIWAGVAYTGRHYIANRSDLATPTQLDAPDVKYAAIAPGLGARFQVATKVGMFVEAQGLAVLSAGGISTTDYYGAGTVYGLGGTAGADLAIGKQLGLRIGGEYNQMNLKFAGTGAMSGARQVKGATDCEFGLVATLAAMY